MQDTNRLFAELVSALRKIDFDKRYYAFYEKIRNHTTRSGLSKRDWEGALATTGMTFRYQAKERFFVSEKRLGKCTAAFIVAFRHDEVELILDLKTAEARSGGPFSLLANSVGENRDPNFSPEPAFPTFPFSNREQLGEIVGFAMALYGDVERALLSSGICEDKE